MDDVSIKAIEQTAWDVPAKPHYSEFVLAFLVLGSMVGSILDPNFIPSEAFAWLKWVFLLAYCASVIVRAKSIVMPGGMGFLFGIFLLVLTFSTLVHGEDPAQGISRVISFWALYIIAFLFVIPHNPDERCRMWCITWLILAGILIALSYIRLLKDPGGAFVQDRFRGVFNNANGLAGVAGTFVAGCAGLYASSKYRAKLESLLFIVLGGLALWSTQSRAGIIGTGAALVTIFTRKHNWLPLILVVVILTNSGLFMGEQFIEVNLPLLGPEKIPVRPLDINNRYQIWATHWTRFLEKPIMGHGMEMGKVNGRSGGHGSYLDLLASIGLLGAIPFFIGLLGGLMVLHRYSRSEKETAKSIWMSIALGIVTQVLIHSVGEDFLAGVGCAQTILVWVFIGVVGQKMAAIKTTELPAMPLATSNVTAQG